MQASVLGSNYSLSCTRCAVYVVWLLTSALCRAARFGRKKTLLSSLIAQIMVGTVIAFNPWFEAHCALRFLLGFISVGIVFSGFVLCKLSLGQPFLPSNSGNWC